MVQRQHKEIYSDEAIKNRWNAAKNCTSTYSFLCGRGYIGYVRAWLLTRRLPVDALSLETCFGISYFEISIVYASVIYVEFSYIMMVYIKMNGIKITFM